ncbi:MAG: AAA family ATPase [Gammaproteobacteria bacterium AqS3]|nr:AAA family ATPase [Gammaproteobacteria bacterium AqS3]
MDIKELIIKDVRCFAGEQRFRIRPLTFLIGENSTGKTTALGCFQVLRNFLQGPKPFGDVDFNTDPYQMGVFSDIARKTASKNGEISTGKDFILGLKLSSKRKGGEIEYLVEFVEDKNGGEPVIRRQKIASEKGDIIFERCEDIAEEAFALRYDSIKTKKGKKIFCIRYQLPFESDAWGILSNFHSILSDQKDNTATEEASIVRAANLSEEKEQPALKEYEKFIKYLLDLSSRNKRRFPLIGLNKSHSFGPTRSKPQRTYDPVKEVVNPEGDDIPMALRRIYRDKEAWKDLEDRLIKFGKRSGLFSEISVKEPIGDSMADPFQLRFKARGLQVNTVDVGYGVSQILPILVRLFVARRPVAFSIHQPEVHLHPRAQAELSTLLTTLIKRQGHQFIIETHSDHMINRARIDIMKKRISPEDVSLIYLEHTNNSVKVHNIEFDNMANLENAPNNYRKFFLSETNKLLGFD